MFMSRKSALVARTYWMPVLPWCITNARVVRKHIGHPGYTTSDPIEILNIHTHSPRYVLYLPTREIASALISLYTPCFDCANILG
jgi:hypothetical protein